MRIANNEYTGVGSRETPLDVLFLMVRLGRTMCDLGRRLRSGDAIGADYAFYVGARLSERFNEIGARIYLSRDGYQERFHNPQLGFYNAQLFTETYDDARLIAEEARGGFWGLGRGGIELMTRNTYQVLSESLEDVSGAMYYWGIPVGKPENEKIRGGTNAALQIAKRFGVKTRINLFYQENQEKTFAWLAMHERPYPYPDPVALTQVLESRRTYQPHY